MNSRDLKRKIDKNWLLIFIGLVTFFISSFFTIMQGISWVESKYKDRFAWREVEYENISKITAGMNIEKAKELFGAPDFVNEKEGLTESIFIEKDYIIQAITKKDNTIIIFSVTTCEEKFNPILSNPFNNGITADGKTLGPKDIILGKTHFRMDNLEPTSLKYFISGATSPSYAFDLYQGNHLSGYRDMVLGYNDSCPFYGDYELFTNLVKITEFKTSDPSINKFRSEASINTYMIYSSNISQEEVDLFNKNFQLGPDRYMINIL